MQAPCQTHLAVVRRLLQYLKEDLSHDSDRREGDRHILRFQKRFLQTL